MDGGTGLNILHRDVFSARGSTWVVDNVTETAIIDGEDRLHWGNVRGFVFFSLEDPTSRRSPRRAKRTPWCSPV